MNNYIEVIKETSARYIPTARTAKAMTGNIIFFQFFCRIPDTTTLTATISIANNTNAMIPVMPITKALYSCSVQFDHIDNRLFIWMNSLYSSDRFLKSFSGNSYLNLEFLFLAYFVFFPNERISAGERSPCANDSEVST